MSRAREPWSRIAAGVRGGLEAALVDDVPALEEEVALAVHEDAADAPALDLGPSVIVRRQALATNPRLLVLAFIEPDVCIFV